jgi:hypothetical protein
VNSTLRRAVGIKLRAGELTSAQASAAPFCRWCSSTAQSVLPSRTPSPCSRCRCRRTDSCLSAASTHALAMSPVPVPSPTCLFESSLMCTKTFDWRRWGEPVRAPGRAPPGGRLREGAQKEHFVSDLNSCMKNVPTSSPPGFGSPRRSGERSVGPARLSSGALGSTARTHIEIRLYHNQS